MLMVMDGSQEDRSSISSVHRQEKDFLKMSLRNNIPGNEDGMIRVADFAHLLNQGGLPTVTDL